MDALAKHPTVAAAQRLAEYWHAGQVRKYTGYPYVQHCEGVAARVALVCPQPAVVAAAWCHDLLEDTECPEKAILYACGQQTLSIVYELTDDSAPEDGNRAARKAIDRERLRTASPEAQAVKLADLLDNTLSIAFHDPDFARTYLAEKALLLEVLARGDYRLMAQARESLLLAEQLVMDCKVAERVGWSG